MASKFTGMDKEDILKKYKLESATYSGSYGSFVDLYADVKSREQERPSSHLTTTSSIRTNSIINVNDLPLPPLNQSETTIFQSAVFIEDGIQYRSIHHRIDPASLKLYRVYYSKYMRWLLGFMIFLNLILAFFEYPTSLSLSSDSRFRYETWHVSQPRCGVTESIEVLCLLAFLLDCCLKFYLIGLKRFVRKPWMLLYAFMIVLSFVDLVISLTFCSKSGDDYPGNIPYTLRLRRFCRPFFFLVSSTIMKKFAKAVVLTLPQIFSVLVLLVLHLYVFAMIGLLVFPRPIDASSETNSSIIANLSEPLNRLNSANFSYSHYAELEGEKYFSSVTQAFVTLLVLLTTANHPDVMMPIYQYNRFSAIYFILFLGIGAFLILNLLIAATYSQFKGFFQKSLQSSFFRRRVAFRAAFTLLARKTHELQQKKSTRLSYVQEVVSKDLIRRLLQKARIPKKQVPHMYTKLENISSQCLINWLQFRDVFDVVSVEPTQKNRGRLPFYGRWRWSQWVQYAIRHRYFYYITYIFSAVNVLMITIELQISYEDSLRKANSRLAYYNIFFVLYYSLEQILKLIGLGLRGYVRSYGNLYEGILTLALIVLEILVLALPKEADETSSGIIHYDMVIRLMNIVIVFRLLRVVAHIKSLRLLVNIIMDLFKNLSGFLGLMVIMYYLFALLGMELFVGVGGPSEKDGGSWSDQCGTYDNLSYYANNFQDFASSIVTLWDVMVVNNWFVFLDKFSRDSMLGSWSKIYFIAWWLAAAIVGMNLFVSLVLDTFLIKWDAAHCSDEGMLDSDLDRFADSTTWEGAASSSEENVRFGIHELLSANLVEPEEHAIIHEILKHRDLRVL